MSDSETILVDGRELPRVTEIPLGYCQCGCGQKTSIAKKSDKYCGHVKGVPVRYVTGHANRRSDRLMGLPKGDGFCACGCGGRTEKYKETNTKRGQVQGQYQRYIHGHDLRKDHPYRVDPVTGCWIWIGHVAKTGYPGCVSLDGKIMNAHRYFYIKKYGPIPDGLQLDHLCRNRSCVNPDHLEPVTPAENTRRCSSTKLTQADVEVIRSMLASGQYIHKEIAAQFNVCRSTIAQIARGARWVK